MATQPVILRAGKSFRTEVEAGPHHFIADEPVEAGGSGEAPTPYDYLAAALGGCTAMTLRFYADREKIPLDGVEVIVTHDRQHAKDCVDCMSTSGYIHRFTLQLKFEGQLTEEQREVLLGIARRCPVAKTLQNEIRIDHARIS